MRIDVVTLFPGMLDGPLRESILARAQARGLLDIRVWNPREHAAGRHQVTDDAPFGGGGGMILKAEPLAACVEAIRTPEARVILLDPAGRRFTQAVARELAGQPHLVLVCGRYEGVDERFRERMVDDELSIGDYVLTGGELAALVVVDAVTRLQPGALGQAGAPDRDSFAPGSARGSASGLLEYPQYTRPETWRGVGVPPVLLSGDHARIERWQRLMSAWRTWRRRPDLLETADLSPEEQKWVDGFSQGRGPADFLT